MEGVQSIPLDGLRYSDPNNCGVNARCGTKTEKRQENRDHDHMRAIGSADNRKRVKQDGDVT